ncbi:MAG: ABC transporter substrate-binding protein, partial [Desulfobacterales bacterium]
MNKKTIFSVLILMIFSTTHVAHAAGPLDALKGPIEQIINILKNPEYKDPSKKEVQREKMWEVARKIFDFNAIARGTISRYRWESFTPQQQKAFTDVVTQFIGDVYFNKIQSEYHNEKVIFLKQEMFTESRAQV